MKETYQTGLWGDTVAEHHLVRKYGMVCLERRYRTKCGEIDLIMQDKDTIVFVEVKARPNSRPGSGISAVDLRKQKRILNAALLFLMKHHRNHQNVRFDLVEISNSDILYIPDAFQPYGRYYR
jgi:putative endonuclease